MEDAALARPEYRADLRKVASGTNSKRDSVPGERGFCDLLSICWVLLSWPCVAWKTAALFKSDGVADSQCSPYKPPVTFVCCLSLSYIHTHHACIIQCWISCLSFDHLFPPNFSFMSQVHQYKPSFSLSRSLIVSSSSHIYAVLRGKDKTRLRTKSFLQRIWKTERLRWLLIKKKKS